VTSIADYRSADCSIPTTAVPQLTGFLEDPASCSPRRRGTDVDDSRHNCIRAELISSDVVSNATCRVVVTAVRSGVMLKRFIKWGGIFYCFYTRLKEITSRKVHFTVMSIRAVSQGCYSGWGSRYPDCDFHHEPKSDSYSRLDVVWKFISTDKFLRIYLENSEEFKHSKFLLCNYCLLSPAFGHDMLEHGEQYYTIKNLIANQIAQKFSKVK